MLISVIFSFRNEEKVIPVLVDRLMLMMENFSEQLYEYELIFVNDASTDRSLETLLALREKNTQIKIINMSRRFGVTPCVIAGLAAAKGDAMIYMDADLQDPPELIPELIKKWREGAEVVHTIRTKRHGESRIKMGITAIAYKLINVFADIKFHENAGDFKLLSRNAVREVLKLNEADPYLRGLSIWIGFKQDAVYYERDARHSGETKFSLFKSLNPYKEFIRGITSFSVLPLYFALFMGFLVAIVALTTLLHVLYTNFMGYNIPGWTAIMAAILFLGGVILFTIGILGIYMAKIYEQIKGRPRYIVNDQVGFDD
jgi:polyisoprenyl-phosphate glycosyltransferase